MSQRLSALLVTCLLIGCGEHRHARPPLPTPKEAVVGFGERAGLIVEKDPYGDTATRLLYLDQGWGPAETLWYYHADQGSVLFPYELFVHLEQVDNERLFIQPEHMARYRFLTQNATPNNPDALPVGMSRHEDRVGLTCAACHTGQINYQGTAMRIDGAPAMLDMISFLHDVQRAIEATQADPAKRARLVAALPEAQREKADALLEETRAWLESYNTANHSETTEGFGRMDAIGRIVNQVIRFTSDPKNSVPPNAPASFPVLWDAPRHDYVQWTGFAPNAGAGGLGRNTGEVIGVFGRVEVQNYKTEQEARAGYASTVNARGIVNMEASLYGLQSPAWPEEVLGKLDAALVARGSELYQASCVSCHAVLDRDDPKRKVVAMVTSIDEVGTDGTSANNLYGAVIPTGRLEGSLSRSGKIYGETAGALDLLGNLVFGVLARQPDDTIAALAYAKLHGLEETPKQGNFNQPTEADPKAHLRSYKARPLNGAWASAPYLHNGSVPTLHDLLLPPEQRPARFGVGRLEYDPVRVGFVQEGSHPFVVDTTVTGNGNGGHLYGTTLGEDDRRALLEYLKSL